MMEVGIYLISYNDKYIDILEYIPVINLVC